MAKQTDIITDSIPSAEIKPLAEISGGSIIEPVSANDFTKDALELEAFMQEPIKIMIHPSTVDGELDVQTPAVNGINQPIIRGAEIMVKRKYVEALARCRLTKYEQVIDPLDRSNIQMRERTVIAYPFSILEDRNPKGGPWIKGIMAEKY